jgi:hypothetical protein
MHQTVKSAGRCDPVPMNRHPLERRARLPRITNEMGMLYRRAVEIQRAGKDGTPEHAGGHEREYRELSAVLNRAFDRKPGDEWSILHDHLPAERPDLVEAKRLLDRYLPR